MQIARSSGGKVLVPAAVVAVAVAAVLTTVATTRRGDEPSVAARSSRPAAPLETQVVKAPPLSRDDTSVSGGPPAPAAPPDRAR